jgi:hypothetical protein
MSFTREYATQSRFPLQVPDYGRSFKQHSSIPPGKSATRHLALRTSRVCDRDWKRVLQDLGDNSTKSAELPSYLPTVPIACTD